jgi:hypothetical protein
MGMGKKLKSGLLFSDDGHAAVVVAMVAVRVVKVAIDEIIDVIPVRHRFMAAVRAVFVRRFVSGAGMCGTAVRVGRRHGNGVFVNRAIRGSVMKVTIVEVIHVVTVLDAGVPAGGAMLVGMVIVCMRHRRRSVWVSTVSVILR